MTINSHTHRFQGTQTCTGCGYELPDRSKGNEAAERLRQWCGSYKMRQPMKEWLDAALAAERRATVERIRARLADNHNTLGAEVYRLDQIDAILDKEAAR